MTLNGVLDPILRYSTEFGKLAVSFSALETFVTMRYINLHVPYHYHTIYV